MRRFSVRRHSITRIRAGLKILGSVLLAVTLFNLIPPFPSRADTTDQYLGFTINMDWVDSVFTSVDNLSFESVEENVVISRDDYLLNGTSYSSNDDKVSSFGFYYFMNGVTSLPVRLNGRDMTYISNDLRPLHYDYISHVSGEMNYYLYDYCGYDINVCIHHEEENEYWQSRDVVDVIFYKKESSVQPIFGYYVDMFRFYNPNSGEHFYTGNPDEFRTLFNIGWQYEGIGWIAPVNSNTPVYRLYNQYGGEHHYTTSVAERDMLVSVGWNDEGIGWYSDDAQTVPLYRQYNPNAFANNHNYTTSLGENDWLVSLGWQAEGIGWYGVVM